ncbi:probable LRR receptor-like serine/threonine-protein kinase At1g06840 isoform X2 [Nymphaea colorata]|uniref:probable LRR receptor-like serine/threonine-protein kinase At1g06840 isoform X2 n=1 Tax=Nymphaea colorata TaxID=210225 RepID=UPI00129D4A7A|nr:probable LRR receptor-like serine/threonine-protein kinase At1g06840 isoform X2 [Nymphaea colorata]
MPEWKKTWLLMLALNIVGSVVTVRAQLTDPSEVSALQAIRENLHDPLKKLNWDNGDPCTSNWTGIFCFNSCGSDGYLHVREIQLLRMNLSGTLAPNISQMSYMEIFGVMWNNITGTIPKQIGSVKSLLLLLLSGNHLTGQLPEEIGFLPNLTRLQIDQNMISGPIPASFENLTNVKHIHLNNNSLSGQIPVQLSRLPLLVHLLLDNNKLSGRLPPELYRMPNLLILSLRNCSLEGPIPDLSSIEELGYLDLSWNHLNGSIPTNKLSVNITTIVLSNNNLSGTIPQNFSGLPLLQRISLENNQLDGSIPAIIWQNKSFHPKDRLIVDLRNNSLSNISGTLDHPANVSIRLQGNPLCSNTKGLDMSNLCDRQDDNGELSGSAINTTNTCLIQSCPTENFFEYVPLSPVSCFCALPITVGFRLKSPGFSDFQPYRESFVAWVTSGLGLDSYQLYVDSFVWEAGPRLRMHLKFFPLIKNESSKHEFNVSEILRLRGILASWTISSNNFFGPYELLNFTLEGDYANVIPFPPSASNGMNKGTLAAIILGSFALLIIISSLVLILFMRRHTKDHISASGKRRFSNVPIKVDGVKDFTFEELAVATKDFSDSSLIGQGGYGKVYRGTLADGSVVAIKRAQEGSLQGEREFLTEIALLSRLHHRNLVSLVGYCDEEGEQMLVYEFMPNGTLRNFLSAKANTPPNFGMRLRIALGAARGIQYLHNEANPPIFHRDIKASNILLDVRFVAKVADFGLSRLAPVPEIEGSEPGHVSTVVRGTPGYLDPEYFLTQKLTDKSDVYSLGVVFFELLSGMHPISHGIYIVREVKKAYQAGNLVKVADSRMGSYPFACLEQFAELAIRCCDDETDRRPSISEVVRELEIICQKMPHSEYTSSELTETEIGMSENMKPSVITSTTTTVAGTIDNYPFSSASGGDLLSVCVPDPSPR